MNTIIDWFINLMLKLCALNDYSFLKLFFFYLIIYSIYAIISNNVEDYLGFENKRYTHDMVLLFMLWGVFAFNTYWLHNVKIQQGNPVYHLKEKS